RRTTHNRRESARKHIIVEPQIHYSITTVKHQINSLIGGTFQKNSKYDDEYRGQGYFSNSQVGSISLAENQFIIRDNLIKYRYAALFGRIGYSYADKYHLNLT